MNKGIIKCLKNSIGEKGNYCYSLPVETTKAVIKELNRLNNIINIKNDYIIQLHDLIYKTDNPNLQFALHIKQEKYLKELKENK